MPGIKIPGPYPITISNGSRWGQTLPFPWEPFTRQQSAGIIARYLHKGRHRNGN